MQIFYVLNIQDIEKQLAHQYAKIPLSQPTSTRKANNKAGVMQKKAD
jgi:hypothetical protein